MALPATRRAKDYFLTAPKFLILSPPKHGKTLCAATYSKFFKGFHNHPGTQFDASCGRCQAPGWIEMNDLLWIAFDPNAIVGLAEQGYDVPVIDLSDKTGQALLPALEDLEKEIKTKIAEHEKLYGEKLRAVVVDTISFLDKNLNEWFGRFFSDPRDKYSAIGERHTRVANCFKSLPWDVALFVLCHAKSDQPLKAGDAVAAAKEKSTGLPGSGGISSAITGQTKGTYEALVDGILPLCCLEEAGKDASGKQIAVQRRVLYPRGGNGFEGAIRYMRFLGKEEPADIGAMLAKIRSCFDASMVVPAVAVTK